MKKDVACVTPDGESLQPLPFGVSLHDVRTQADDRGTLCELFDLRWGWRALPVNSAFCFTIRPGITKGWGLHERNEDRYFILFGEIETLLYDERTDSPTRGLLAKIVLSAHRRRLLNIPPGIWHADRNLGSRDAVVLNFPTIPYDHANPDKFRLPLNNDRIPHKFDHPRGG